MLGLYRVFQPAADGDRHDTGQPGVRPEFRDAAGADGGIRPVPPAGVLHPAEASAHLSGVGAHQHPAAERGVFPVPDHVLAVGGGGAAVSGAVLRGAGQRRAVENAADEGKDRGAVRVTAGVHHGQRYAGRRHDRLVGRYRSGRGIRYVLRQLHRVQPLRSGSL